MSLWVNEEWWNVPPHGYGWKVEAKDERGFSFERTGGTISARAARRACKRAVKAARKIYREGS